MLEDSDGEGYLGFTDEFVAFSEPQKSLTAQIASRSRAIDFTDWACICPILIPFSRLRTDIRIYRELRTDPLVGAVSADVKQRSNHWSVDWSAVTLLPGLPFHPRHARRSGSVPHHR